MSQDHLTNDLNWCSGPGRVSGCMPSQIMRPQMDPYKNARLVYDFPRGWIGNREDPSIWLNSLLLDVFFKTMSHFLWNEDDLCLMTAFGIPDDDLSVLNVSGSQPKNLSDSHPAPRHELQYEPVS